MFSILCSFSDILAKLYVGTLPGGLAPPPTGNPGSVPEEVIPGFNPWPNLQIFGKFILLNPSN